MSFNVQNNLDMGMLDLSNDLNAGIQFQVDISPGKEVAVFGNSVAVVDSTPANVEAWFTNVAFGGEAGPNKVVVQSKDTTEAEDVAKIAEMILAINEEILLDELKSSGLITV